MKCQPAPICSVEEFYAHALALEREAGERYREFADWFRNRGEEALSGLCTTLADAEGAHFREMVAACRHLELPTVPEGEFRWLEGDSPEAPGRDLFYRVVRPAELLKIALGAELNATAWFDWVARTSTDPRVRTLATGFLAEEAGHVRWVEEALDYHLTTHA